MKYIGGILGKSVNESQKIEFVGAYANSYPGTTSQITQDFANYLPTLKEDDFLIVTYGCGHTASVTLSIISAGWTTLTSNYINASSYDTNMIVAYKRMGTTPDSNVIFSSAGSTAASPAYTVLAFRNVDTTTAFDVSNTSSSATNTHLVDGAAITPVTRNAWIVVTGFGAILDSTPINNKYTTQFTSSDLDIFYSAGWGDTTDGVIGTGVYTRWTTGAFNPAAWTSSSSDSSGASYQSVTMALRPQLPTGVVTTEIPYRIGLVT